MAYLANGWIQFIVSFPGGLCKGHGRFYIAFTGEMAKMEKMAAENVKNIINTANGVDKARFAWYAFDNFLRKGECVMKLTRTAMFMMMPMCMCRMSMRCCANLRCADR